MRRAKGKPRDVEAQDNCLVDAINATNCCQRRRCVQQALAPRSLAGTACDKGTLRAADAIHLVVAKGPSTTEPLHTYETLATTNEGVMTAAIPIWGDIPAQNPETECEASVVALHEVSDSFVDLAEWDDNDERIWFADGAIEPHSISVIAAPEKSGKSWALLDLAVATAVGGSWLHQFEIHQPGRVLLMETENGPQSVVQRLKRLTRAREIDPAAVLANIDYFADLTSLDSDDLVDTLREFERAFRRCGTPALVIIDPLRGHLEGNEDSAKDIVKAMRGASELRRICNAPVLIAHHLNKSGKVAGSRAIRTCADLLIEGSDETEPLYSVIGRRLRRADAIAKPFRLDITHEDDEDDSIAKTFCRCRFIGEKATPAGGKTTLSAAAHRILELLGKHPEGLSVRKIRDQLGGMSNRQWSVARDQLVAIGRIQSQQDGTSQLWKLSTASFLEGL